jgi:hypothetical protein
MAWAKLCDSALTHPKLWGLPDDAFAFWIRAILYASAHLTDGLLDDRAMRFLRPKKRVLELLIREQLLDKKPDGTIEIHDFLDYNPTRKQVLAERERARERMKRQKNASVENHSEQGSNFGRNSAEAPPEVHPEAPPEARANFGRTSPSPSRPDPTRPDFSPLKENSPHRPPVASSRAHARAQAREADVPSTSQAPDNGTVTKRNTTSHDVTERRTTSHAVEPPARAPAQKAGGQAAAGDLEAELRKLLEADRYYQGLTGTNAQELAQRLAFHADAKKPAHVIAAVRRALDLAAASSYNAATTNKSILAFAQRASEADMAQSLPARTGRPGLAAAEPRPITTKTVGIVPDTLTEEERQRTEEMFRFRRACGWTPLQPWPLPAMVAAGWAEGMPWPLPSQSGDKAPPRPLSGPATAKAVASEAS